MSLETSDCGFWGIEALFFYPPQQWYFDRIVILPVLALLIGLYFARSVAQENPISILLFSLYVGYMIFFFRATNFNLQPRFVFAAHIWFVPILAMGLYGFWLFLLQSKDAVFDRIFIDPVYAQSSSNSIVNGLVRGFYVYHRTGP